MTDPYADPEQLVRELEAMSDAEKLERRPPWPPTTSIGVLTQERLFRARMTTAELAESDARATAAMNALKRGPTHA